MEESRGNANRVGVKSRHEQTGSAMCFYFRVHIKGSEYQDLGALTHPKVRQADSVES